MELTLTYYTQVFLEDTECSKKLCKEVAYDLTKDDIDEFVKSQGYDDYIDYFKNNIDFEEEDLEEEMRTIISRYKNERYNYLEVYFYGNARKDLEQFLIKKHQDTLIYELFE